MRRDGDQRSGAAPLILSPTIVIKLNGSCGVCCWPSISQNLARQSALELLQGGVLVVGQARGRRDQSKHRDLEENLHALEPTAAPGRAEGEKGYAVPKLAVGGVAGNTRWGIMLG
jgi:hypothetical protein